MPMDISILVDNEEIFNLEENMLNDKRKNKMLLVILKKSWVSSKIIVKAQKETWKS